MKWYRPGTVIVFFYPSLPLAQQDRLMYTTGPISQASITAEDLHMGYFVHGYGKKGKVVSIIVSFSNLHSLTKSHKAPPLLSAVPLPRLLYCFSAISVVKMVGWDDARVLLAVYLEPAKYNFTFSLPLFAEDLPWLSSCWFPWGTILETLCVSGNIYPNQKGFYFTLLPHTTAVRD